MKAEGISCQLANKHKTRRRDLDIMLNLKQISDPANKQVC